MNNIIRDVGWSLFEIVFGWYCKVEIGFCLVISRLGFLYRNSLFFVVLDNI